MAQTAVQIPLAAGLRLDLRRQAERGDRVEAQETDRLLLPAERSAGGAVPVLVVKACQEALAKAVAGEVFFMQH